MSRVALGAYFWTVTVMDKAAAPGWYKDPGGSARVRWWDGTTWTSRTRERSLEELLALSRKVGPLSNEDVIPVPWIKVGEDGAIVVRAHDNRFSKMGLYLGAGALLLLPLLLGVGGLSLGVIGWRRGERLGPVATVVGVAGAVIGVLLATYVAPVAHHH